MFFLKYKKIIIGLVAVIVLFVLYSMFFAEEPQGEELLVSSNQTVQAQIVGNEIVAALNQIQTLKLSRDIFEDPVFRSLIDRSIPIPEEPVGKSNPFSPIGSNNVSQGTSTRPTTNRPNTIINTTNTQPASEPVI